MALLDEEIAMSDKLMETLGIDWEGNIPTISRENVSKVLARIKLDPRFEPMHNPNNPKAALHWINKLKKQSDGQADISDSYESIIENIVDRINVENSTHINSDGIGRNTMVKRILGFAKTSWELLEKLKNFDEGVALIERLSEATEPENNGKHKPTRHFSFATKFCHFIALDVLEGEARDLYPIYDSAIEKALKDLIGYKKMPDYKNDYRKFVKDIDKVIEGKGVSRHGFDQLMWYSYRNRR